MKKLLKFTIVLSIIFTMLGGNVAVLAVDIVQMANEKQIAMEVAESENEGQPSVAPIAEESPSPETTPSIETTPSEETSNDSSEKPNTETAPNEETNSTPSETPSNTPSNTLSSTPSKEATSSEEPSSDTSKTPISEELPSLETTPSTDPSTEPSEEPTQAENGSLHIKINLKLPNENTDGFTVSLQENGTGAPQPLTSSSRSNGTIYYEFDNLQANSELGKNYDLRISHKGYQDYKQIVPVKSKQITFIEITNSFDVNTTVEENARRAIMGVGDVVGNGDEINDDDVEAMIGFIESNAVGNDLNGDGKVNIVDLSYVAINKGNKEAQLCNKYEFDQLMETEKISFEDQNTETTKIEKEKGDFADIFKNNDKFISIGPAKEGTEISAENPVELKISLPENQQETQEITIAPSSNSDNNIQSGAVEIEADNGQKIIAQIGTSSNSENGKEQASTGDVKVVQKLAAIDSDLVYKIAEETLTQPEIKEIQAKIESDGTIVVDLEDKVAVKKITIRVTGTKSKNLADIAKVEFLNGMEDRIPAPVIDAPTNLTGEATADALIISWDSMPNVTGYEVEIRATLEGKGEQVEYHQVDGNQITLSNFYGAEFKDNHYTDFYVRVQSINGEWKSGFGETKTLTPKPNQAPPKPDNLSVQGGARRLAVTWKKMKSTRSYNVEYKKYDDDDTKWQRVATEIPQNSFTIDKLEDGVRYQVRVQGVNDFNVKSVGPWSSGDARTTEVKPAELPRYKAINLPQKDEAGNEKVGELTDHIKSAICGSRKQISMVDSKLDNGKEKTALGVFDNDYNSYWQCTDWDDGGTYTANDDSKGVIVEFDDTYKMNYITLAQIENKGNIGRATIYYWGNDEQQAATMIKPAQVVTRKDKEGRLYTAIKLPRPIDAKKIRVQIGDPYYVARLTIAEMRFYNYDPIEDEVNELFKDQMHLELKDGVNIEKIDALQSKLETTYDHDELNPEKDSINEELQLARDILNDQNLKKDIIDVDTTVTAKKDGHIPFLGGLNAWQPLGVVAPANSTIKVYVGNPDKIVNDSTELKLIVTQYHAEAGAWMKEVNGLKIGLNEIPIPQIISSSREKGGSIYIEYTGNNDNEKYSVRVSGGEKIPVLDLTKYDRSKETDRKAAVGAYLTELRNQVDGLEAKHNDQHKGSEIEELDYEFNENEDECIFGATEVVLDQMMYSVSAKSLLAGLDSSKASGADETEKFYNSLVAMEDMVDLFYSHKGLTKDATKGSTNQYPVSRLNIRYHTMFAGAAMYAGGKHIGIPYGDVATLAQGVPIKADNGKWQSGGYFGWGISHEIGHIINDSYYVHGEVTNNYFSVLSQAHDTNESVRFKYPEVYKKVTSGKKGNAQDVFTQLGMYWQFHLANDNKGGYNFKMYDPYEDQLNNLVFARMDKYAREFNINKNNNNDKPKTSAPKAAENGIDLVLMTDGEGKTDNNLIRLACAATQHNVLSFFEKWGKVPNEETRQYAEQWPKLTEDDNPDKEKAIWYINDDARAYQLAHGDKMTEGTKVKVALSDNENKNQKVLTLSTEGNNATKSILGYEIIRTSWEKGEEINTPVGFITTQGDTNDVTYTDTIETLNNRTFEYKVVAYDKYLNSTEQCVTERFKISHDGVSSEKSKWEISTNYLTATEKELHDKINGDSNKDSSDCSAGEEEINGESKEISVEGLIDNNYDTDYVASVDGQEGQITIALHEKVDNLVGLSYKSKSNNALQNYRVEVSTDNREWTQVTPNSVKETVNGDVHTAYFNPDGGDKLCVYPAQYIRLMIQDENISISEIDLKGITGDNIELSQEGIGILQNEVDLGEDSQGNKQIIPQGSIVFKGTYKGNPAYNIPLLFDGEGNIIETDGAIFADPLKGDEKLGEVSEGIWIYWVDPNGEYTEEKHYENVKDKLQTVRAELYRVDDATKLEGERLTSDTLLVNMPRGSGSLPNIEVSRNN